MTNEKKEEAGFSEMSTRLHGVTFQKTAISTVTDVKVKKRQSNHCTAPDRPRGLQEFQSLRFQENRHMKVVRLSALRTGRLYTTANIPGTHFC